MRTSEADSGGFIRFSRATARPRTPGRPDLIIDVPLWGSLKLGVALYSKGTAPAQRRFLRGVGWKMEGWEMVGNRDAARARRWQAGLAGGVQHEESDAARRHSCRDGQSASPSIVDSLWSFRVADGTRQESSGADLGLCPQHSVSAFSRSRGTKSRL